MSYYRLLGLEREPFSTSPDPDFFYQSHQHHTALLRLMIEIRLKRGLSLVLGDVGIGKTTLSRKFFCMVQERKDIEFHMILDPVYHTEELFLQSLTRTFQIQLQGDSLTIADYKEALKEFLYQKSVIENKTCVLLIDEAQKLNALALEELRILLNYETNDSKMLQVVLMSQVELLPRLRQIKNLWDRVSLRYVLNLLDERETKELILFRLKVAGDHSSLPIFSDSAMTEIYRYTQGSPRQIAMLCHQALRILVMKDKSSVDESLIRSLIAQEAQVVG
jgi:general secretion pathway protein A